MAFWYDGNKNYTENKREKDGIVYYIRGVVTVDGKQFERYAINTHFVTRGEDIVELMKKYVLPLYEEGDILSIGEKVVSMCQNNTVEMSSVKVGFIARNVSKFAKQLNATGVGVGEPYKLQLAINMKGAPRVLFGAFCGAVGKLFGKSGWFYKIVGADVAGIDGFYRNSLFPTYRELAVLVPKNPDAECNKIKEATGISAMVVDANDLAVEIMGKSSDLDFVSNDFLADLIRDNPAGQDDECTPFIIIRDLKGREPQPYVPMRVREEIK